LCFEEGLPLEPEPSDAGLRRWLRDLGPAEYRELCTLERADLAAREQAPAAAALPARRAALERLEQRAAAELERKPALTLSDLALDVKALMTELGMAPGPQIGKLLNALLDQVIEQPECNTKEHLIERARRWLV
jgi:hypothetical protein